MSLLELEQERLNKEIENVENWWKDSRWNHVKRDYTSKEVAALRGSVPIQYPSNLMAKKFYKLCRDNQANGKFSATYGALDPV